MTEQLGRLEHVYRQVLDQSRRLNFDRKQPQQVYAACLHALILAQLSACLTLLRKGERVGVASLLRDLLETYADLVNLCRCPEYIVRLHGAFLGKQGRVLKRASEAAGPVLRRLAGDAEPKAAYEQAARRLAEYEHFGLGVMETRERFERAGLTGLYDSVYALLAIDSAHNLVAMPDRFLEEADGHTRLNLAKPWQSDLIAPFINTLAGVIVDAYRRVARLSPTDDADGLARVTQSLKEYVSGLGRKAA